MEGEMSRIIFYCMKKEKLARGRLIYGVFHRKRARALHDGSDNRRQRGLLGVVVLRTEATFHV